MILPIRYEDREVTAFDPGEQTPEWRYDATWLTAAEHSEFALLLFMI